MNKQKRKDIVTKKKIKIILSKKIILFLTWFCNCWDINNRGEKDVFSSISGQCQVHK